MRETIVCSDCHRELDRFEDCPCWDAPTPVASRPMWDHPLTCGHIVRLDHPKPSRRQSYHCAACSTMRRLTGGQPAYHPAAGQ